MRPLALTGGGFVLYAYAMTALGPAPTFTDTAGRPQDAVGIFGAVRTDEQEAILEGIVPPGNSLGYTVTGAGNNLTQAVRASGTLEWYEHPV